MRQAYAHVAVLTMAADADDQAPGAAITTALGGPQKHHTAATSDGDEVRLRVLFAADPKCENEVRDLIDAALAGGNWQLVRAGCARIGEQDRDHARRLLKSR